MIEYDILYDNKKKELTGFEPVTLGPAIPRSTPELQFLVITLALPQHINQFS